MVPQDGIEPPHPAYKTGPLPLRIQGRLIEMSSAPRPEIESGTQRLTAVCSTSELPRSTTHSLFIYVYSNSTNFICQSLFEQIVMISFSIATKSGFIFTLLSLM